MEQCQQRGGQIYLIYLAAKRNATGRASPGWAILIDLFGCHKNVTRRPFTPSLPDSCRTRIISVLISVQQAMGCLLSGPAIMRIRLVFGVDYPSQVLVLAEDPSIASFLFLCSWLVMAPGERATMKYQRNVYSG